MYTLTFLSIEMEIVMENQILHVDNEQEAISDSDLAGNLSKNERRLSERLIEAQEDEVRALEHFQRAQAHLEQRRKRVERIQGKLVLVRELLAELQITDQQTVYTEHELVIATTSESAPSVHSEEVILVQPEQDIVVAHESDGLSSAYVESPIPGTSVLEQEAASINMNVSDFLAADSGEERGNEQGHTALRQETEFATDITSAPVEAILESEASSSSTIESTTPTLIEQEPIESDDSSIVEPEVVYIPDVGTSTDSIMERVPTKPLELEQQDQHAARSLSPEVQSSKEAWIAAESAMQNARNTAHGIATSIAFLSQNDGLSNEFMEELVRKQADANKELLKAQDAARAAYERFVQAQRNTESAASLPVDASMNTSEDHSLQKQENASLPPAEDNGADQTAKFHAIRLYKEW
jgi:hypothetical protein